MLFLYDSVEQKMYLLNKFFCVYFASRICHSLWTWLKEYFGGFGPVMWPSNGVLRVNPVSLE